MNTLFLLFSFRALSSTLAVLSNTGLFRPVYYVNICYLIIKVRY